jgi:hypothetical protein
MLRDGDIRRILEEHLVDQHRCMGDTTILHEMKVYRPTARVDLAVVNGELCAFEIKSDVDSLCRLSHQIDAYSAVFDRVSLVTTSKHLKSGRQKVPAWWGISVSDGVTVSVRRTPKKNPNRSHESLLYSLSRGELLAILAANGASRGLSARNTSTLVSAIMSRLGSTDIDVSCRQVLKRRRGGHIPSSSSPSETADNCSAE